MATPLPAEPLPDPDPLAGKEPSAPSNDELYIPHHAVEALNPSYPETFDEGVTASVYDETGGMVASVDLIDEARTTGFVEPFGSGGITRAPTREIFSPSLQEEPDGKLLGMFVTNQRLRELWNQLEALQEEVIQNVRADRTATDTYQQDLLYASSLLLKSAANYDEAKQIMYRVRADLKREQRVTDDTRRYRPRILLYYATWLIVWLFATTLNNQYRNLIPEQIPVLKLAYAPILFGILGALCNGAMALQQHTTAKRDFDPIHISWYLITPILGGLLGLVTFVFFVVAASSFTPGLATNSDIAQDHAPLVIWLMAFVVGWQQNIIFKLLNRFLSNFTERDDAAATTTTTSSVRPTPTVPSESTNMPEAKG